ncbi:MAG: hypothetical protein ABIZ05_09220 [Pseudonocardiaceae bacterium]
MSSPLNGHDEQPGIDAALRLSSRTLDWLADNPRASKIALSVWDKLTELERAGHRPDTIDRFRRILAEHRPTSAGRCRACPRLRWRRRRFPCLVWHEIRDELFGWIPWGPQPPSLPVQRR